MAGRGRGRGSQFSAIQDGLGLARGPLDPGSSNDPPPVYPPLGSRPHYPQKLPEHDYMLAVMKDFVNQMNDSQFNISATDQNSSEKGIVLSRHNRVQGFVPKPLVGIDWKRYPSELMPSKKGKTNRKRIAPKLSGTSTNKKEKSADELLAKLEKAEKDGAAKEGEDQEKSDKSDDEDEEDKASNKAEEMEEDDDIDEELDEGTDYANNYFDNGEGYLDEEDDNLDEGGIY